MDMKVWVYDKGDFSMRLDVETGTFEHILLDAELDEEAGGAAAVPAAGVLAADGRAADGRAAGGPAVDAPSGVMGRSSGWMPRRGDNE